MVKLFVVDLGALRYFVLSTSVITEVFYCNLLKLLLRLQSGKTILLFQALWNRPTVPWPSSFNVGYVIDMPSGNWRSGYFWSGTINFAHLNDMSSALSLHFVDRVERVPCLTLELISPGRVNVLD